MLFPDSQAIETVTVTNNFPKPAHLYLLTSGWVPANASDYLTLSWNYDGTAVEPDEPKDLNLTLAVAPDIEGIAAFSFNITITGVT